MNTLAALRVCLAKVEFEHQRRSRFADYVGTAEEEQNRQVLGYLRQFIAKQEEMRRVQQEAT